MDLIIEGDPLLVAENGPSGQPRRTHDEADVFLAAVQIHLLVGILGIALHGRHEAARHLDPVSPFGKGMEKHFNTIPKDKKVIVYCYTGQTSAYLAGYLRVIGYDARSLLYGTNGIIFDKMVADRVANTFAPETEIKNYDYVK